MWLDLVAVALLGIFVALGAWRGALATGLGLATLVGAYLAAVFLAPTLAPALASRLGLSEFWALPLAGAGVFVATYTVLGVLSAFLRRLSRRHADERSARDRFLGGVFGAVRGAGIALLVSYLALWVDALRVTGATSPLPSVEHSRAAALTGEVVESGIGAAFGEERPGGRMAARIAARPGVALAELQGVLDDPQVGALREDARFWSLVEHGAVDAAMARGSFLALQRDPALRRRLADLALVPEAAADDPGVFRDAMGEVLREVGPPLRRVREDPALQELMEDPEVVAMLQSNDTLGLLGHPGIRGLVDRVTSPQQPD